MLQVHNILLKMRDPSRKSDFREALSDPLYQTVVIMVKNTFFGCFR